MGTVLKLYGLLVSALVLTGDARFANRHNGRQHQHKHEALEVGKRQGYAGEPVIQPAPTPTPVLASTTSAVGALTYVTPSPGAFPVAVTKESQIVTSYVPQFTLCELPPIEFFSISPVPSARPSAAPYRNYSVSIPPGNGTCTTIYSSTETMVCATTLTDLATKYTVTNCNQELTFSTEYGYVLETPTPTPSVAPVGPLINNTAAPAIYPSLGTGFIPTGTVGGFMKRQDANATAMITAAPSIETLTTYYLAPWQQLTAGTAPSQVDLKVCRNLTNGTIECIREYQVWETSLLTLTSTTISSVNISTTIHGSSQIIVETFIANVTEQVTTFSLSTTLALELQTEFTTTNSANRTLATSTSPAVYETLTVERATPSPTSTTTIRRTSTIYVGTSTVTIQSSVPTPTALATDLPSTSLEETAAPMTPLPSTSVDFTSLLAVGR